MKTPDLAAVEHSLDPEDWHKFRAQAHEALDAALDSIQNVRNRPVWQPVPEQVRAAIESPSPVEGIGFEQTYREFQEQIFPYPTGNIHPRFWGYVHGTGTASGIVTDLLAAAMNSNCGGRDHGALYVERAVIEWCREWFGYPHSASGVLVSGTSMATLVALVAARNASMEYSVRREGVWADAQLSAYASAEAHESVAKALEIIGLGAACLRRVRVNERLEVDVAELARMIREDRANGRKPFCVVGSLGTVNTGAIDDLSALADLCEAEKIWFHVDGAFGALCVLSPELRPLASGIERADSIAFDFHKWMFVQYDAGCVLMKSAELHQKAFSMRPPYLAAAERGLAGGSPWFCEFGPELSRGFRALKVWFAVKEHGTAKLGAMIKQNCDQARYLADLVKRDPRLELLHEPALNIVNFRVVAAGHPDLNTLNREIVADLQESGVAAPSTTVVGGKTAIRCAITNHRSRREDFHILVEAVIAAAEKRAARAPRTAGAAAGRGPEIPSVGTGSR